MLRKIWTEGRKNNRKLRKSSQRLYSPKTVTMFESRMVRWVGHVKRMRKKRNAHSHSVGDPEELHHKEEGR
jgi:hypothetical protein